MAQGDNRKTPQSSGSSSTSTKKNTRIQKIRENKALFGVVVLVGLIILAAIGVGAYYAIDSLTSNDNDSSDESNNDSEDQDDDSDNSSDDEDSDDEDSDDEDNNSSDDEDTDDSDDSDDNSSDNDDDSDNNDSDDNNNASAEASGHSAGGLAKSLAVQNEIARTGVWRATDYIFGDITDSNYTVQLGDTLWEIADGYFGNAYRWTEIRNRNTEKIDVLPNGEEALIYPGTTLNLGDK